MAKKNKFRLDVSETEERTLQDMMDRIGVSDTYELFINAAVLLMWAIRQREHGRKIASIDPNRREVPRTEIDHIQQHKAEAFAGLPDFAHNRVR